MFINDHMRRRLGDYRTVKGTMLRGNNVYRQGSNSAKPLDLQGASKRRITRPRSTMTQREMRSAARKAMKRRK